MNSRLRRTNPHIGALSSAFRSLATTRVQSSRALEVKLTLITRWTDKLRRHRQKLTKFGVIGIAGVIADVGGFNLLRYAGGEGPLYDRPLTAKVISVSLGILVSWIGNRFWTFSATRRKAIGHEFLLFLGVSLIGLGISLAPLAISHYLLDMHSALDDNISANLIGLGLATLFRYWAMNKIVFPVVQPTRESTDPAAAVLESASR
jgi:putative flippase GtrA